jgi:hypothetical protein
MIDTVEQAFQLAVMVRHSRWSFIAALKVDV